MRLPIDTGTVKFAVAGPAEPVLDYETRAPKLGEAKVQGFSTIDGEQLNSIDRILRPLGVFIES
jgi:hypothetical protein